MFLKFMPTGSFGTLYDSLYSPFHQKCALCICLYYNRTFANVYTRITTKSSPKMFFTNIMLNKNVMLKINSFFGKNSQTSFNKKKPVLPITKGNIFIGKGLLISLQMKLQSWNRRLEIVGSSFKETSSRKYFFRLFMKIETIGYSTTDMLFLL